MMEAGPAVKVTVYLNRDTGSAHGFLVDELLAFLLDHGVEGATVLQATAGYGAHGHLHAAGGGDVAGLHLPVVVSFLEQAARFEVFRDSLLTLVTDGLIEIQPTTVLRHVTSSGKVIS